LHGDFSFVFSLFFPPFESVIIYQNVESTLWIEQSHVPEPDDFKS
jgi:hypothetical protein